MGWTDWKDWTGFLRDSGEALWTAVGRSWFRLMICSASWVFPEDTTQIQGITSSFEPLSHILNTGTLGIKPLFQTGRQR